VLVRQLPASIVYSFPKIRRKAASNTFYEARFEKLDENVYKTLNRSSENYGKFAQVRSNVSLGREYK
jgi:hypothetical protein